MTIIDGRQKNGSAEQDSSKFGLFFKALAGESIQAQCVECGAVEWVIPLDEPLDEPLCRKMNYAESIYLSLKLPEKFAENNFYHSA